MRLTVIETNLTLVSRVGEPSRPENVETGKRWVVELDDTEVTRALTMGWDRVQGDVYNLIEHLRHVLSTTR